MIMNIDQRNNKCSYTKWKLYKCITRLLNINNIQTNLLFLINVNSQQSCIDSPYSSYCC